MKKLIFILLAVGMLFSCQTESITPDITSDLTTQVQQVWQDADGNTFLDSEITLIENYKGPLCDCPNPCPPGTKCLAGWFQTPIGYLCLWDCVEIEQGPESNIVQQVLQLLTATNDVEQQIVNNIILDAIKEDFKVQGIDISNLNTLADVIKLRGADPDCYRSNGDSMWMLPNLAYAWNGNNYYIVCNPCTPQQAYIHCHQPTAPDITLQRGLEWRYHKANSEWYASSIDLTKEQSEANVNNRGPNCSWICDTVTCPPGRFCYGYWVAYDWLFGECKHVCYYNPQ